MKYAEVSVNAPAAQRQTFSYSIPSELIVNVGQAVYVPFGQKTVQGLVVELTDVPAFEPTETSPELLTPSRYYPISMSRWRNG